VEGKAKMVLKKGISTSKVVLSVQASSPKEEICSSITVTDFQSSLVEEEYSLAFSSSTVAMEPGYSNGASLSSEAIYTTDKVICVGLCFVSTSGYQLC
jgi:kinesin family protein 22